MDDRATAVTATMICPETGAVLSRDVRPFTMTYKGQTVTVALPGYYPEGDGEGVLVGDDMAAADAALRDLKERIDGLPSPATIRRLRAKLKLSQREAGAVFKVGPNAFHKYEGGLVEPSGPTVQLMRLLDRHPGLLDDLRG
jgi:HTH-type transcriptional regulator/antitoxin MqsA